MTARGPVNPNLAIGTKPRYTLPESSVLLGISLALVYRRIAEGALLTVHDGRRTLVTDDELRRYASTSRA
jgi:hypothetical protein